MTGTTATKKKKKQRMDKIIDLANEIKATLESEDMPEVTQPIHLKLIVRGIKSVLRGNVRQDVLEAFDWSLVPAFATK